MRTNRAEALRLKRRSTLELEVFAGQEKSELSMIEVARAILEARGRDHEMYFNDLVNEIQNYLERSATGLLPAHLLLDQ